MTTTIENNGTFTVRKRTYNTEKGNVTCIIQHGIGMSKEYKTIRWQFKPNNAPCSFGNLSKKTIKAHNYR